MSTISSAVNDTATILRRDFRHSIRYPMMTINGIVAPVIMMLLFVYVFGGAISSGFGAALGGGLRYIDYLVPGIIVMTVGSGCATTSVNINADMNEGIINRFRTMAISRTSVLTGQVIGSVIRTLISLCLVIGIALLAGFRSSAGRSSGPRPLAWSRWPS